MADYANFSSPLPHPGEVLREDYMEPMGLTAGALARAMGLKDRTRIERISRGEQAITADTALRLGKVFSTTAEFWMNMQAAHDLSAAAIAARDELAGIAALPGAAPATPPEVLADPADAGLIDAQVNAWLVLLTDSKHPKVVSLEDAMSMGLFGECAQARPLMGDPQPHGLGHTKHS